MPYFGVCLIVCLFFACLFACLLVFIFQDSPKVTHFGKANASVEKHIVFKWNLWAVSGCNDSFATVVTEVVLLFLLKVCCEKSIFVSSMVICRG